MERRAVFAAVFGASAIACVAGPFAVVAQRHAPKPKPLTPITHTQAPPPSALVVAESAPPPVESSFGSETPHAHTFRVHDLATDARYNVISGTIGKHGFLGALAASGLSPKESHRVLVGFSNVKNLERLNASDSFSYAKMQDHVVAFELVLSTVDQTTSFDFFQEHEDDATAPLTAQRISIPIERRKIKVGLVLGPELRASLATAGLNDSVATIIDDALDGHAELADLRTGAHLRMVLSEERMEGVFTSYAPIDALEFTAPSHGTAKPAIRVYWYAKGASESHHHGGYYDAQGRQPYHGAWRSPIPMARISSRFNPNRMHPVLHTIMPHNGVDFAAPPGTPIYAAASGTIRSVGDSGPCGNMVQIDHPNGLISAYCHMSRFGPISVGEHVETRQLIGYVGQTGRATGPHLHFAVKKELHGAEVFIDPLTMRLDGVRIVPAKLRGDFDETRKNLDADIDSIVLPASLTNAAQTGVADPAENTTEGE